MFISWDPPYTLPGLTVQYIISVGTEQHELISTNYTYCPLNLTNNNLFFEVTSSNGAGDGFSSNINVLFQSSNKRNIYIVYIFSGLILYQDDFKYYRNGNWSLYFLIPVSIMFLCRTLCCHKYYVYIGQSDLY